MMKTRNTLAAFLIIGTMLVSMICPSALHAAEIDVFYDDFDGDALNSDKWLVAGCRGEAVGATCITEPCGNSDMSGWQTTAVRDGDEYIINGEKIFCTNIGAADFYLVYAKTAETIDISKGYGASMFLIAQSVSGCIALSISVPREVSEYSTLGGISG